MVDGPQQDDPDDVADTVDPVDAGDPAEPVEPADESVEPVGAIETADPIDAAEEDPPNPVDPFDVALDEPETDAADQPLEPAADQPAGERFSWLKPFHARSTRRALVLCALGALLIAGLITVLPVNRTQTGLAAYLQTDPVPATGSRGNQAFNDAKAGDCLNWPDRTPDDATIVDCGEEHRFEVAESVDMRTFPGSEYGPDAAPPSPARIQQISQEQCQVAVRQYLGPKFDPNSRFTISMLWSGDKAWRQHGERRMLCGLQLPGPDSQQLAFKGRVADVDQSKVWPAGTCLGIDPASNQPTDIPVDCASPHAMEVTGSVNLGERFPGGLPPENEQDDFIKETCTRLTDEYLAPLQLRTTTLTLIYSTISLPSWSAGSHQVACSIGATLGNGGWATLINSAKGGLLINGQPPVPPPDIPPERLNLPAIPMPDSTPSQPTWQPDYSGSTSGSSGSSSGSSSSSGSDSSQHLPRQAATATATAEPTEEAPAAGGNTFNPPLPPELAPPAPAPAPADAAPPVIGPPPGPEVPPPPA